MLAEIGTGPHPDLMKSLLGGGALVLVMAAGAWSSDVVSGPDRTERPGLHQKSRDHEAGKPEKPEKPWKAGKPGKPTAADRAWGDEVRARGRAGATKPHPHGEPPGLAQRDRGEPPPWSGGPEERSEEPPGLAKTGPRD